MRFEKAGPARPATGVAGDARSKLKMMSRNQTVKGHAAQAGFTLVELMVAIAVFTVVALAAYAVWDAARWSFERGGQAADAQQRTRLGFDRMISDLRLAGYDYNADGNQTPYSDQADEQIEFIHQAAIVFRANLDYEDAQGGREYGPSGPARGSDADDTDSDPNNDNSNDTSGYETAVAFLKENTNAKGFPIVTTANNEIVIYALVKPGVANDNIVLKLDTRRPRIADMKDLGQGADGERYIKICGLALTHDDPPYTLQRITLADQDIVGSSSSDPGCIKESPADESALVRTPLADDIRSMTFGYHDSANNDYYCTETSVSDGSCPAGKDVPFAGVGGLDGLPSPPGGDALEARRARRQVARISVELVGMTEKKDFRYTDPSDDKATQHRKVRLYGDVSPPNLRKVGQMDAGAIQPNQVKEVTACSGQCGFARVQWKENAREEQILGYVVNLYRVDCGTVAIVAQVTSKFVTGRGAHGQPGYLYAVFTGKDSPVLLREARLLVGERSCFATQIYAKNVHGEDGPPSDDDDNADEEDLTLFDNLPGADHNSKLYDETRPDPVSEAWASGVDPSDYDTDGDTVPDTNGSLGSPIVPEIDEDEFWYPKVNQIELSWAPPSWVMDQDASDVNVTGSDTAALSGCHMEEDSSGATRTPLHEVHGLAKDSTDLDLLESSVPDNERQGRYLIFRSTVQDFDPRDHHLIAVVDEAGYTDRTAHHFRGEGADEVFRYTDAFPVENCVHYYYRFRVADDCWDGTLPAAVNPGGDYTLSPFYPPLYPGNSTNTDVPSGDIGPAVIGYARPGYKPAAVEDLALDIYQESPDQKFFLSFDLPKRDQRTLPQEDDNSHIAMGTVRVYAAKNDAAPQDFTVPQGTCGTPPCNVPGEAGIWYFGDVYMNTDPTGAGLQYYYDGSAAVPIPANEAGILSLRIGHHDEDGDDSGTLTSPAGWRVELPFEDESAWDRDGDGTADDSGDTGLLFALPSGNDKWYFKVVSVQCKDTNGANFTSGDEDQGGESDWIKVPCDFGSAINGNSEADPSGGTINVPDGNLEKPDVPPAPVDDTPSAYVEINDGTCPTSLPQRIVAKVRDTDTDDPPRGCQARLVLFSGVTGDMVSSGWKFWAETATCNEIGTDCDDFSSYWSSNEFCWTSSEVEDLMVKVQGRDIKVVVEVRESRPKFYLRPVPGRIYNFLPCIGRTECDNIIIAADCLVTIPVKYGPSHSTENPLIQNDDFTGSRDPISGEPNGLPDGITDCYQSVHWTYEEACANGALDIKEIRILWQGEAPGGPGPAACTGRLVRAFWDWDGNEFDGIEIYRSPDWPWPEGKTGASRVDACDSNAGSGCDYQASCDDPDPIMGCLWAPENSRIVLRMEFDRDTTCDKDTGECTDDCEQSMKNAEIQVEIDYARTLLSGATEEITQVFLMSPTTIPIPDTCNPCDQDNDSILARTGCNEEGNACGGTDCDDLEPRIGAAADGNCCDADGDGYEKLGEILDPCTGPDCGSVCDSQTAQCGNPCRDFCNGTIPGCSNQPGDYTGLNDCDDADSHTRPEFGQESKAEGTCEDGLDNNCNCFIDGLDHSFECL